MPPVLSVVIASHQRPLRLRWLLNALAEQTLDRSSWEVVVCFHEPDSATAELLAEHPLAREGALRAVSERRASVGAKRNRALAAARGRAVVFTDDDCRPPSGWLNAAYEAATRDPEAIIQGPVEGDPDESAMRRAPYPRTQSFDEVPTPWAECCNILYPRELVVSCGGFSEHMRGGEDTELNRRALKRGARYLGEPSMLTYHAVFDESIGGWIRSSLRWGELPGLFKRHPELRKELLLRIFWKREHAWLLAGMWALAGSRRNPARGLVVIPWGLARGAHGGGVRGAARGVLELPGWALIDLVELLVLLRGSVRYRTLVL